MKFCVWKATRPPPSVLGGEIEQKKKAKLAKKDEIFQYIKKVEAERKG